MSNVPFSGTRFPVTLLVTVLFAGSVIASTTTGACVKDVMAQIQAAKTQSAVCLEDLERDIQAAEDAGLPLSPEEIERRTQECQDIEFAPAERVAALRACRY